VGGATFLFESFIRLLILVISFTLHEFAHAAMSTKLGDPTPRLQKRLTLNPVEHFDPVGFLFTMLMAFRGLGFAWARPVETNPSYYDDFRRGRILTALAGPMMNLALAMFGLGVALVLYMGRAELPHYAHFFMMQWVLWNIVLGFFNLIPIPGFDGGVLFEVLAPERFRPLLYFMLRYRFILFLALIFTGVLGVILSAVLGVVMWFIGLIFGYDFVGYLFGQ
jgi:Zn-dependent protease